MLLKNYMKLMKSRFIIKDVRNALVLVSISLLVYLSPLASVKIYFC